MKDRNGLEIKIGDIVMNTSDDVGIVISLTSENMRIRLSEWLILNLSHFCAWTQGKSEVGITILSPRQASMRFELKNENKTRISAKL